MRSRLLAASAAVLLVSFLTACGGSDEEPAATGGECSYTKSSEPGKKAKLPPSDPTSVDSLRITTNRGDITTTLEPDAAPCTVSSFASLAEQGFYDDTKCHRLVPGFVLQCGDPTATGSGGPGYSFADELTGKETYPAGTLAMANSGPDTNGSQFFIVLAEAELPPSYTVFGTVDAAGLKVAQEIEKDGNGADGVAPAKDVVIESVS
jgi:peptidyl-prolyl cis-trans isomerase B (cyclophilin B)